MKKKFILIIFTNILLKIIFFNNIYINNLLIQDGISQYIETKIILCEKIRKKIGITFFSLRFYKMTLKIDICKLNIT